ncbi:Iron-containing alcohol dehydrogenase [anaerobic digester metagenome]
MLYSEFSFVPQYVQGKNASLEVRRILFPFGSKYLFLLGCGPLTGEVTERIENSFTHTMEENIQADSPIARGRIMPVAKAFDMMNKPFEYRIENVEGLQTSQHNIDQLWDKVKDFNPDVVIGVGGGKAMDMARAIHHKCQCKVVLMPTSCATNAPGTKLNVVYNNEGTEIVGAQVMLSLHSAIIVDPELIIKAPPSIFASGVGDCIAAYYESLLSAQSMGIKEITSTINWSILETCARVLFERGEKAYYAAQAGYITNDFELCLEHIVLGNGLASTAVGGLSMAHMLDEVFLKIDATKHLMHGQHVGYGVIPMLIYYSQPLEEIYRYVDFARALGIPVTLEELGLANVDDDEIIAAAQSAINGPTARFCVVKFTPEDLCRSMKVANKLVHAYIDNK